MYSIKNLSGNKTLYTSPTASTLEEAVLEAARSDASVGIVRGGVFAEVATLDLRGAQLQGVDLAYARFGPLDVTDANLSNARLCGLELHPVGNTDLSGADLTASTIGSAGSATGGPYGGIPAWSLDPERLRAVNLRGANVAGAKVNQAYLIWLDFTTCQNLDRLKVMGRVPANRGSIALYTGLERRNWESLYSAGWSAYGPQYEKPKSGCYVATAIYGNYDSQPVWVLRRYRDETLSRTALGRSAISLYCAVSPWLVRRLGGTRAFTTPVRRLLDRIVAHLEGQGYSSGPYLDREA